MLIAIYGLPRSGKTFLCNEVVKLLNATDKKCVHLKPTKMVDNISSLYTFREPIAPLSLQCRIVDNVYQKLKRVEQEYPIVILDCHYAYPDEKKTPVSVFFQPFHEIFDEYFYMDTDVSVIMQRMIQTNGIKDNYDYTLNDLKNWKEFEIMKLAEILGRIGKKMVCLTGAYPQKQVIGSLQICGI